ncbi:hypothetical protein ACFX15_022039 [Malus domestica]
MARERDHLYITVPNLFRCPISMDVIRSPVSFCTGVTYEFESVNTQIYTSFKKDMIENGDLGFFQLPLVGIPTSFRRPEVQGDDECSGSSSVVDNEFVRDLLLFLPNGSPELRLLMQFHICLRFYNFEQGTEVRIVRSDGFGFG